MNGPSACGKKRPPTVDGKSTTLRSSVFMSIYLFEDQSSFHRCEVIPIESLFSDYVIGGLHEVDVPDMTWPLFPFAEAGHSFFGQWSPCG